MISIFHSLFHHSTVILISQPPPLPISSLLLESSQLINDFALALPERERAAFMTVTEAMRTVTEHYANGIPGTCSCVCAMCNAHVF